MVHLEHEAVVRALRTLPRRQREVLVLRYYDGASEAEIAETLGIGRRLGQDPRVARPARGRGPAGGIGMSTDELERLERRLEAALHDADDRPVDVPAGRAVLGTRLGRQQQQVRRWTVVGVAASVLAVVVTTSLVVAGLPGRPRGPAGRTAQGHPVALRPAGGGAGGQGRPHRGRAPCRRLRIVVRADGTGTWNSGTTGDSEAGPAVADYPVTFVGDGPGRAVVRDER